MFSKIKYTVFRMISWNTGKCKWKNIVLLRIFISSLMLFLMFTSLWGLVCPCVLLMRHMTSYYSVLEKFVFVQVYFSLSSHLMVDFYHVRNICLCSKIAISFPKIQDFLFVYLVYLQQEAKIVQSLCSLNHSELMHHVARKQDYLKAWSSQQWLCDLSEWT